MSTTPLPPPELIFFDAALQSPLEGYTADQMQAYATQARADLEAENARLREALKRIESMCAAPPDFSDAAIQDVARAALENRS